MKLKMPSNKKQFEIKITMSSTYDFTSLTYDTVLFA